MLQPREAILANLPFLRFLSPERRLALFDTRSALCRDLFVRCVSLWWLVLVCLLVQWRNVGCAGAGVVVGCFCAVRLRVSAGVWAVLVLLVWLLVEECGVAGVGLSVGCWVLPVRWTPLILPPKTPKPSNQHQRADTCFLPEGSRDLEGWHVVVRGSVLAGPGDDGQGVFCR